MRKTLIICLILLLSVGTVFAEMKATVISVSGKVERQSGENWIPVKEGDVLSAGTMVSTGFRSSATVKFDGSVIELSPLSRLTLSEFAEKNDSRDSSVYLDAGKISANIKSSDAKRVNFTVNSPAATASVRGTAGDVDCMGNVTSTESVWSVSSVSETGEVVGKAVPVSVGMSTSVKSDGSVSSPQAVTVQSSTGSSCLMSAAEAGTSEFVSNTSVSDAIQSAGSTSVTGNTIGTDTSNVNIVITF